MACTDHGMGILFRERRALLPTTRSCPPSATGGLLFECYYLTALRNPVCVSMHSM